MMDYTMILVAVLVILILFKFLHQTDPRLPPSPIRSLPIFGHLFSLPADVGPAFKQWRKKCGDIFCLHMGGKLVVVLNGYDLIHEALVKKADFLSDRPPSFVDTVANTVGKGVVFSNGVNWKEQRTVSLSILRSFGMGKNLLAEKIQQEIKYFIKKLYHLEGKATNIQVIINISVCNIISSVLLGHRFDYEDKDFQELMRGLGEAVKCLQNVGAVNFFFWLRHVPGDFFKVKPLTDCTNAIVEMLQKFLDKKSTLVENSADACHLIEAYIHERNKRKESGLTTHLDDQNLLKIMFDLFTAGTETISTTISWSILYALNFPEMQEKIFKEIQDKIGTERAPTIQDKSQLTYLNAFIMETQRLSSILPQSVIRMCNEEVQLRGFTIPKGAIIIPNLDSVLHDESTWGSDALCFRPERFIDENNMLKNPEQWIPFGIGRRVCLGEALARMELFLYLATMFQRLKFLPESPGQVPQIKPHGGAIISPEPFLVRAVERN